MHLRRVGKITTTRRILYALSCEASRVFQPYRQRVEDLGMEVVQVAVYGYS